MIDLDGKLSRTVSDTYPDRTLAYIVPRSERIGDRIVSYPSRIFYGLGGISLGSNPTLGATVTSLLRDANYLSVRDNTTRTWLQNLGIEAKLVPDITAIYNRALTCSGLDTTVHEKPDVPYVLLQVSDQIATKLAGTSFLGSVVACAGGRRINVGLAGIAPHHDSIGSAHNIRQSLVELGGNAEVQVELSPHHIARLISRADLVIASSLHYRILAMSFRRPRVSLENTKVAAYVNTWDGGNWMVDIQSDTEETMKILAAAESVSPIQLEAVGMLSEMAVLENLSSPPFDELVSLRSPGSADSEGVSQASDSTGFASLESSALALEHQVWQSKLADSERVIRRLGANRTELEGERAKVIKERDTHLTDLNSAMGAIKHLEAERAESRVASDQFEDLLRLTKASFTWRVGRIVTAPIRWAARKIRPDRPVDSTVLK